jgi:ketosteroid isomerase-like protein
MPLLLASGRSRSRRGANRAVCLRDRVGPVVEGRDALILEQRLAAVEVAELCAGGDRGVSEWTIRGTQITGESIEVRGCDLFEFTDGKISRKDSFWKIVD